MYIDMENWAEIRRRVLVDGLSKRAACREYDIHWDTLRKILEHPEPPGYRRTTPRPRPKLDPFLPVLHRILEDDRKAPRKQRHTARRIFERLRDEHGYQGGLTVVKQAVAAWKTRSAEVFIPLAHRPGEAQVDFGSAEILLGGRATAVALFVMTLPYSDALFVHAFPRECGWVVACRRLQARPGLLTSRLAPDHPKLHRRGRIAHEADAGRDLGARPRGMVRPHRECAG